MHDRLNYNGNIFNNIFIHWFLVFGLIFLIPKNVYAFADGSFVPPASVDVSQLTYYEYDLSYFVGDKNIWSPDNPIKIGKTFKFPDSFFGNSTSKSVRIYIKGVSGAQIYSSDGGFDFTVKKGCNYSFGVASYYPGGGPYSNKDVNSFVLLENGVVLGQTNFVNSYYQYFSGFYVACDKLEGLETTPDIDKNDVNTYPVGHLEIINPSGALNINYSNKYNAYPVDVKVKGKIPFQIKFSQESEISADKVKSILQKEIYNTMDFTMVGSNNTYTRSDKTFLNDNDPKLVLFGTKSDWIDNEYLTFEYTFKLYLKDKGDYNFNSFTINVPTWWEHTFFGIGTDKFKDFKADDVKFSINAYKDLNGDGIDDETGEVIPPQTDLDVDNDDWEHMTFLEKAEYLITSIPSFLGNIFDSLINTIANTVQLVNSVVAQGGTIAGLVTNLFNFFPAPIPQMITVTIGVMIFITFLSWVKK